MKLQKARLVPAIVFLNTIVFLLWYLEGLLPVDFMENHFLVSWDGLLDGRYWQLLTSVFSHNMFLHFFLNMYVLINFGSLIEMVLGKRFFLKFYLVAGIVSSLSHVLVSAYLIGDSSLKALGASGAISGLILLFCFMFPKEKILLLGFIPIPAIFGALAFIGIDLWGLFEQTQGGGLPIGHGAHLGGAFTGIFYYFKEVRPQLKALE